VKDGPKARGREGTERRPFAARVAQTMDKLARMDEATYKEERKGKKKRRSCD